MVSLSKPTSGSSFLFISSVPGLAFRSCSSSPSSRQPCVYSWLSFQLKLAALSAWLPFKIAISTVFSLFLSIVVNNCIIHSFQRLPWRTHPQPDHRRCSCRDSQRLFQLARLPLPQCNPLKLPWYQWFWRWRKNAMSISAKPEWSTSSRRSRPSRRGRSHQSCPCRTSGTPIWSKTYNQGHSSGCITHEITIMKVIMMIDSPQLFCRVPRAAHICCNHELLYKKE